MINKSNIKSFIAGSICTIVLAGAVTGFASGGIQKNITATYNNIKLVVDGKPVAFKKDSNGNKVEPFIYGGTTYLPVRAIGEAVDKKVDWNASTQTVYIGEVPGSIKYVTETLQFVGVGIEEYKLSNQSKLNMGGNSYNTGYKMKRFGDNSIVFNLNGQYNLLEGEISSHNYNHKGTSDLEIYIDEKLYKTITVSGEEVAQKITIPLSGANQLKIIKQRNQYIEVGLGDFILK